MKLIAYLCFCGILLSRLRAEILTPQFLCEDGTVFFVDAYNSGIYTFLLPYAGYAVVFQRLVALAGSYLDPGLIPTWDLSWALAVLFAAEAVLVFLPAGKFFGIACGLVFALVPFDGSVLASMTNSQWVLGAILLFVSGNREIPRRAFPFLALFLILAALSGPFSLLLLPVYFLRWYLQSTAQSRTLMLIVSAAALLQLILIILHYEHRVEGIVDLFDPHWPGALLSVFAPQLFLIAGGIESAPSVNALLGISVCLLLLLSVDSLRSRDVGQQLYLLGALLIAGFSVVAYLGDPDTLRYRPRYALIPHLGFCWAALAAVKRRAWAALIPASSLAAGIMFFFSPGLADFHWASRSKCIGAATECELPLHWPVRCIRYFPEPPKNFAGRRGTLVNYSPQCQEADRATVAP